MLMAVAACMVVSANAQNPDAVKKVMGLKDFKEAKSLVESSLSSMNDEERAKSWNKVVDLALAKFNKEQEVMLTNQVTKKDDPYDKDGMYEAARVALESALECEKYDQLPNAKGKIKPKFHKANQDRLNSARTALINAGQDYYNNKDFKAAAAAFGAYVNCKGNSLYSDFDFSKDQYLGQIAYFASLASYNSQDYPAASRYAGVALADTAVAKDAMDIKILSMKGLLNLEPDDMKLTFQRNRMENMVAKTQAALNMKALGLAPEIWLERSGLSNDPIADIEKSKATIYTQTDNSGNPTTDFDPVNPEVPADEVEEQKQQTNKKSSVKDSGTQANSGPRKDGANQISGYYRKGGEWVEPYTRD